MSEGLPNLRKVYQEQDAANNLFLAGALVWAARCGGCGIPKTTNAGHGMAAGYELLEAGWTPKNGRAYCPGCSELF